MFKQLKHRKRSEKGQALVEMALVLPILLMILCGIIDFGWIFFNQLTISYLSREGARYGIVHADDPAQDTVDRVKAIAPDFISDNLTVTVTFSNSSSPRLGDVTVHVESNVVALTPITGVFVPNQTVLLSSDCVMKAE